MMVIDYDAKVVNSKVKGKSPLPELEDVILEVMINVNRPVKREEIIDMVCLKTGIEKDSMNRAIDNRLKILKKAGKVHHNEYGVWEAIV